MTEFAREKVEGWLNEVSREGLLEILDGGPHTQTWAKAKLIAALMDEKNYEDCAVSAYRHSIYVSVQAVTEKMLRDHDTTTGMRVSMGWTCKCGQWMERSNDRWKHVAHEVASELLDRGLVR